MNYFILMAFFTEVLLCLCLDWRRFKTLLTPGIALVLPFSLVLIISLLCAESLEFISFYIPGLMIWIIGFGTFYIAASVVNIFFHYQRHIPSYEYNIPIAAYVIILLVTLSLVMIALNSTAEIGSKELAKESFQGGVRGRLSNLILLLIPFIFWSKNRILLKIITLVVFFIILILFASKTYLIGSVIVVYFMGICRQKVKISFFWIFILLSCCSSMFFVYYWLLLKVDINTFFTWGIRHFFFYLTSGVLPLGEVILQELPRINGSNLPFYDLLASWFNWTPAYSESEIWIITDLIRNTKSNVFTFFGAIYLNTQSWFLFIFYSIFWGALTSLCFNLANKTQNMFLQIANSWILAGLSFGWFGNQLKLLRFWEIIAYCLFSYCLYLILLQNKQKSYNISLHICHNNS